MTLGKFLITKRAPKLSSSQWREFSDCAYSLHTELTASRLSGQLPDCPDNFQTVWTVSGLFRQLPDFPDSNQTYQIVLRQSRTFQTV